MENEPEFIEMKPSKINRLKVMYNIEIPPAKWMNFCLSLGDENNMVHKSKALALKDLCVSLRKGSSLEDSISDILRPSAVKAGILIDSSNGIQNKENLDSGDGESKAELPKEVQPSESKPQFDIPKNGFQEKSGKQEKENCLEHYANTPLKSSSMDPKKMDEAADFVARQYIGLEKTAGGVKKEWGLISKETALKLVGEAVSEDGINPKDIRLSDILSKIDRKKCFVRVTDDNHSSLLEQIYHVIGIGDSTMRTKRSRDAVRNSYGMLKPEFKNDKEAIRMLIEYGHSIFADQNSAAHLPHEFYKMVEGESDSKSLSERVGEYSSGIFSGTKKIFKAAKDGLTKRISRKKEDESSKTEESVENAKNAAKIQPAKPEEEPETYSVNFEDIKKWCYENTFGSTSLNPKMVDSEFSASLNEAGLNHDAIQIYFSKENYNSQCDSLLEIFKSRYSSLEQKLNEISQAVSKDSADENDGSYAEGAEENEEAISFDKLSEFLSEKEEDEEGAEPGQKLGAGSYKNAKTRGSSNTAPDQLNEAEIDFSFLHESPEENNLQNENDEPEQGGLEAEVLEAYRLEEVQSYMFGLFNLGEESRNEFYEAVVKGINEGGYSVVEVENVQGELKFIDFNVELEESESFESLVEYLQDYLKDYKQGKASEKDGNSSDADDISEMPEDRMIDGGSSESLEEKAENGPVPEAIDLSVIPGYLAELESEQTKTDTAVRKRERLILERDLAKQKSEKLEKQIKELGKNINVNEIYVAAKLNFSFKNTVMPEKPSDAERQRIEANQHLQDLIRKTDSVSEDLMHLHKLEVAGAYLTREYLEAQLNQAENLENARVIDEQILGSQKKINELSKKVEEMSQKGSETYSKLKAAEEYAGSLLNKYSEDRVRYQEEISTRDKHIADVLNSNQEILKKLRKEKAERQKVESENKQLAGAKQNLEESVEKLSTNLETERIEKKNAQERAALESAEKHKYMRKYKRAAAVLGLIALGAAVFGGIKGYQHYSLLEANQSASAKIKQIGDDYKKSVDEKISRIKPFYNK